MLTVLITINPEKACCGILTQVHPLVPGLTLNQYTTWKANQLACPGRWGWTRVGITQQAFSGLIIIGIVSIWCTKQSGPYWYCCPTLPSGQRPWLHCHWFVVWVSIHAVKTFYSCTHIQRVFTLLCVFSSVTASGKGILLARACPFYVTTHTVWTSESWNFTQWSIYIRGHQKHISEGCKGGNVRWNGVNSWCY